MFQFFDMDVLGLVGTALDINILIVWILFAINSLVGLYTWFRRWKYAVQTERF